jgi:hypothetical protein
MNTQGRDTEELTPCGPRMARGSSGGDAAPAASIAKHPRGTQGCSLTTRRRIAVSSGVSSNVAPQDTMMPGKRVQFDPETWHALDQLAKDGLLEFQELADKASHRYCSVVPTR